MKKRVEQLINGIFEYEVPPLILSEEKIEQKAQQGQLLHGSFTASHPEQKKVKGFLYSSNPRVTFDPMEFYGAQNRIYYQIDTNGLQPGEETEGYFTLCTDLGEYSLPYCVSVSENKQEIGETTVSGIRQLSDLAREDFQAAYPAFISPAFERVLQEREPEALTLYAALKAQPFSFQSMEEFLIGCGEKEPVEISIDRDTVGLRNPGQSIRETIIIKKNGWGFLRLDLSSDSRFIRLDKKVVTTDEFVGNQFVLEYIIDTNFLHAGKNFGRIKIGTCYQSLYLDVQVIKETQNEEKRQRHVQKMMQRKLETLYIDFRVKRIDMQTWIDRSLNVIGSYKRAGGRDAFADLFQVQLLFADEKRTKGYKLLQEIEQHPERMDTPEKYGFYLYISTFFQREAVYVDQVESRIQQMLLQNRDSWILQWILLYLQERLMRDDGAKWEVIEEQVKYGCCSPIMYLEACHLLRKDPFLLRRLGNFELKILSFAARQNLLTEELAHQVGNLALYSREYSKRLFEVLQSCYQVSRTPEIVRAICSMLIAGERKEPEYFYWYSLGVNLELRITGLYEYYMETMDQRGIEKMPQIIRMYFIYNNTLDYHKRARIYRNISDNKENIPQVYRSYRGAIEQFVTEQLSMGRIDENLSVLYERYLTRQTLTHSLAEKLVKCLFTFEITCKNPNIRSAVVVHRRVRGEQVVPLSDGKAQVQIYTEDARILLEDTQGNRYASTSLYMAERLLDTPMLLRYCMELVPQNPGLVLFVCGLKREGEDLSKDMLPYFKRACEMELPEEEYKADIRKYILDYYRNNPAEDDLFSYLKEISYPPFLQADKRTLMSLLTQEGMYEEAFSLLETYGSEQVPLEILVRICSQSVLAREYEENTVLTAYCSQCYSYGKYDDNILAYLLMYYDGPIEDMKRLWNTGRQFDLDTMALEEKILSLLLFTRTGTLATEQIFASYQRKLGRKKICKAYLNLKAYEYFVKDLPVNDLIFAYIEHSYQKDDEQEDISKLALMRYYSRQVQLEEWQKENVRRLLAQYNGRGLRFAFYQKFPEELRLPYQLEDKVFLEYAANPENTVILHYREKGKDEYREEHMKNCFEGINVKEFILFYGEELECYTEEIRPDQSVKVSDHRILSGKRQISGENSRFELINRMARAQQDGNEECAREELETYRQLDYLTKEIFTLI